MTTKFDKLKYINEILIKELSSNFESDLSRLIKTTTLITQMKDSVQENIKFLNETSSKFRNELINNSLRLYDLEKRFLNVVDCEDSSEKQYDKIKEELYELVNFIRDFRESTMKLCKDIDSEGKSTLDKINMFYEIYNMELNSAQQEIDKRLKSFKENLRKSSTSNGKMLENNHENINEESEKQPEITNSSDEVIIDDNSISADNINPLKKTITIIIISLALILGVLLFKEVVTWIQLKNTNQEIDIKKNVLTDPLN